MSAWRLIDEEGGIWNPESKALSARLNTGRSGRSLDAFLVQQMGFAAFRRDISFDTVWVDWGKVNCVAAGVLADELACRRGPVVLYRDDGQKVIEAVFDRGAVINRLRKVWIDRNIPDYVSEPLEFDRSAFAMSALKSLTMVRNGSMTTVEEVLEARHGGLGSLLSVAENGMVFARCFGNVMLQRDPEFCESGPGKPIEASFDVPFAQWSSIAMREAWRADRMLVSKTSAVMRIAASKQARRVFGERLIAPVTVQGTRSLLVLVDYKMSFAQAG